MMKIKMSEKKEKTLPPRQALPCQQQRPQRGVPPPGKIQIQQEKSQYNSLPRDCEFAYLTPGYYATGYRISDVYKTEVDFSEYRNLMFLEDAKLSHKWGVLKSRIPFPEGRITDLPGTRDLHYNNYCLRSLTSDSAKSWRKSIKQDAVKEDVVFEEETKREVENEPDENISNVEISDQKK